MQAPNGTTPKKHRLRSGLGWFFFTGFIFFVSMQVYQVRKEMIAVAELGKGWVVYSKIVPDKAEYAPGELVHFNYTRTSDVEGTYPLLLLTLDSFENMDTGEIYAGTMGARVIKQSGTRNLRATRKLPDYASPGTYTLEGWISSQTNRLTRAEYYSSEPFRVVAPKSAQKNIDSDHNQP